MKKLVLKICALVWLSIPIVGLNSTAMSNPKSCGESDIVALSDPLCRNSTISKVDEFVILPAISLLKFDRKRFQTERRYKNAHVTQRNNLEFFIAHNVEIDDATGIFFSPEDSRAGNKIKLLLDALRDFKIDRAGCLYTRESDRDGSMSRSILVSYPVNNGGFRFFTIHFYFEDIAMIHQSRRSKRKSKIISIDIYPFAAKGVVSPVILENHIIPYASAQCDTLLDQMDATAITALRKLVHGK